MAVRDLAYRAYEHRIRAELAQAQLPRHVGVILDGNRRWARASGASSAEGHQAGADKVVEFLGWCDEVGVDLVTLWLLSTDNLNRSDRELDALLGIISGLVERLVAAGRWRIHPVGSLDLLPDSFARQLKGVAETTEGVAGTTVNVAVGYGGRREIAEAVRSLLAEHAALGTSLTDLAERVDVEDIAKHLYTRGQPDPDLVIRTSGEQRLSGFMLWQSAHSEFYFCEAHWPEFREVDFLRALRSYSVRQRRYGK